MAFTFQCPQCNTQLEAQDEWDGLETTCPSCQASIKISKNAAPPPPAPFASPFAPPVSSAAPAAAPKSGVSLQPEAKSALTARMTAASNEKFPFLCPACGTYAELNVGLLGKQYTCPACCQTVTAQEAKDKECPFCGEKIKFNATVCRYCQRNLPGVVSASNGSRSIRPAGGGTYGSGGGKKRTTYVLLGVFLGACGVHDFYAGFSQRGIIKLAITFLTCGFGWLISWIWAIIDICQNELDAQGNPLE